MYSIKGEIGLSTENYTTIQHQIFLSTSRYRRTKKRTIVRSLW